MRNLYSQLGIKKNASQEHIRKAIAQCSNTALKRDAERVLLNYLSKAHYDRSHATLEEVADLRAALGLNHSEHWNKLIAAHYTRDTPANNLKLEGFKKRVLIADKIYDALDKIIHKHMFIRYAIIFAFALYITSLIVL